MKYLGGSKKVLGMEIHKDTSVRKLWLFHKIYIEKVLNKFDMTHMSNLKVVSTSLGITLRSH